MFKRFAKCKRPTFHRNTFSIFKNQNDEVSLQNFVLIIIRIGIAPGLRRRQRRTNFSSGDKPKRTEKPKGKENNQAAPPENKQRAERQASNKSNKSHRAPMPNRWEVPIMQLVTFQTAFHIVLPKAAISIVIQNSHRCSIFMKFYITVPNRWINSPHVSYSLTCKSASLSLITQILKIL